MLTVSLPGKVCGTCKARKSVNEFYRHSKGKYGRGAMCRDCSTVHVRKQHHLRAYGLTPEDYAAVLAEQGGCCAICGLPESEARWKGKPTSLQVDHDHTTGIARGLVCGPCNRLLITLDEDGGERRIAKAREYLASPPVRRVLPDLAAPAPQEKTLGNGRPKRKRATGDQQLALMGEW